MADTADFTSYAVARWPHLVRTLVLLGHSPAEADALAAETLVRCVSCFDRASREGDVDVDVYRTLLEVRRSRRRPAAAPGDDAVEVAAVGVPDLEWCRQRLGELAGELAAMPVATREAAALTVGGELDEFQVDEVLGGADVPADRRPGQDHEALEAIPVRSAPVEEVLGRWRDRRRRRTRLTAAGVGLALVVVAAGTWWGTRPPVEELPRPDVVVEENPADLAWYANGELHLAEVAVELPQLVSLVEVPDGAVVTDRDGRVLLVDQRGEVSRIGLTRAGAAAIGDGVRGLVAWTSLEDGAPELVVHDTVRGRELARRDVPEDATPVALDGSEVFYNAEDRAWSWSFDGDVEPGTEPGGPLVDVASRVRAAQFSEASVLVSQPLFDIQVTVPGADAMLSPDGDFLLTRVDFGLPDEVRVYVAASGEQVPSGVGRGEIALAASFGDDHTVTYVVARREHAPEGGDFVRLSESGPQLLRTCDLDTDVCETVAQFSRSRGEPVLPH